MALHKTVLDGPEWLVPGGTSPVPIGVHVKSIMDNFGPGEVLSGVRWAFETSDIKQLQTS